MEDALLTLTDLHHCKSHETTPDSSHFETDAGLAYKLPVKEDAKEKGPSSSPADSKTDEILEAEKLCH